MTLAGYVDISKDRDVLSNDRFFAVCLVLRALVERAPPEERAALRTLVLTFFGDFTSHVHNTTHGRDALDDVLKTCGLGPED